MRQSGILMHITSLPGPEGCGTLGPEAYAFADALKRSGVSLWQVLPCGPTGYGESPYQSSSVFAGNFLLVSVRKLAEDGLLKLTPEDAYRDENPEKADFDRVRAWKSALLRRAYRQSAGRLRAEIARFADEHPWARDYALFAALHERFGGVQWTKWPDRDLRMRKKEALRRAAVAEAGEIDHAAHSHDAATVIQEVLDMDAGVRIAFDFYRKHPRQTLIVIASDHETGGLTFAPREPRHLARLQVQKHSMNVLSDMLKERMVSQKAILTWDETKAFLGGELGLWKSIKVSWEDEKMLRDIYEATIARRDPGSAKDLYADNSKIVSAAVDVLNRSCRIYWSGAHTSGYVPVFAIGPGSELFSHRMDNVDVARMIRQAAF